MIRSGDTFSARGRLFTAEYDARPYVQAGVAMVRVYVHGQEVPVTLRSALKVSV
jgi:hypothetical protein